MIPTNVVPGIKINSMINKAIPIIISEIMAIQINIVLECYQSYKKDSDKFIKYLFHRNRTINFFKPSIDNYLLSICANKIYVILINLIQRIDSIVCI